MIVEMFDGQHLVLAHSALAALTRNSLLHGMDRVDDGLNHPLVLACIAALGAVLAIVTIVGVSIWHWRRTHHALRSLRFVPPEQLPDIFRGAAARTGTTLAAQVVNDPRRFAFTQGWFRPRIIVSTGLLSELPDAEIDAVLLHERTHARRRDPLRAVIARAAATTFAVVPGSGSLMRAYLCRLELIADASAVAVMKSPLPLASALHRLLNAGSASPMPATVGLSPTDIRIDRLLGEPTSLRNVMDPPSVAHVLVFALGVVLFAGLILGSAHSVSTCVFGASGSTC